jgi:hypothetical protein
MNVLHLFLEPEREGLAVDRDRRATVVLDCLLPSTVSLLNVLSSGSGHLNRVAPLFKRLEQGIHDPQCPVKQRGRHGYVEAAPKGSADDAGFRELSWSQDLRGLGDQPMGRNELGGDVDLALMEALLHNRRERQRFPIP